jgi:hypothetical protein
MTNKTIILKQTAFEPRQKVQKHQFNQQYQQNIQNGSKQTRFEPREGYRKDRNKTNKPLIIHNK